MADAQLCPWEGEQAGRLAGRQVGRQAGRQVAGRRASGWDRGSVSEPSRGTKLNSINKCEAQIQVNLLPSLRQNGAAGVGHFLIVRARVAPAASPSLAHQPEARGTGGQSCVGRLQARWRRACPRAQFRDRARAGRRGPHPIDGQLTRATVNKGSRSTSGLARGSPRGPQADGQGAVRAKSRIVDNT